MVINTITLSVKVYYTNFDKRITISVSYYTISDKHIILSAVMRPHHDSIFVRLPAINWQCRHIGGPHMVVGRSLLLVRRRGTHCQNVYVILLLVLLFLSVFWKHSSAQSTSVSSALEALAIMRYINLRFTLDYITLSVIITLSVVTTDNIWYSEEGFVFPALCHYLLSDAQGIWLIGNLCCLSAKILLWKKWRKDTNVPANPRSPGKQLLKQRRRGSVRACIHRVTHDCTSCNSQEPVYLLHIT